jgi:hypothetical protein
MRSRGIVGIPLWDYGQKNSLDIEYSKVDPEFYRNELDQKLEKFRHFLPALEMQQEAQYQSEGTRSWARLDLYGLNNFRRFLVTNEFWAIHARTQGVDVSEYENEVQRTWSVRETQGAIDFAFRVNADAVTLHPGTYNLRGGRFWPKADEALQITNNRRVIFTRSLVEIIEHFVSLALRLERDIESYQERQPWLVAELRGLTHWLALNFADERVRYKSLTELFHLVERHTVPIWLFRYCRNPDKGLHLVLENVEPPNFLCCTPAQLASWHRRMMEIYTDTCDRMQVPAAVAARYAPRMVLNPNHLLNSKVILTQPSNRAIGHIFEDYDQLFLPFVTLPCDIPVGSGGVAIEPLMNRFVREYGNDVLYVHLAGSQKMDNTMTTHDPVRSFRTKMYLHADSSIRPIPKYSTAAFDPEVELNLEEVVQVIGYDRTYVLAVFDCPDELLMSSWIHADEFLSYLETEHERNLGVVRAALEAHREAAASGGSAAAGPGETAHQVWGAAKVLSELESACFYIRPHRKARELWKVGYDEAAFYAYDARWGSPESTSPVDIFATVKDGTGKVWVRGLIA